MQFIENKRVRLVFSLIEFYKILGGINKIMLVNQSQIADLNSVSLIRGVE